MDLRNAVTIAGVIEQDVVFSFRSATIEVSWRVIGFLTVGFKWWRLIRRHRAILTRILAGPDAENYIDEALQPVATAGAADFVDLSADRIPNTCGAPPKQRVAVH